LVKGDGPVEMGLPPSNAYNHEIVTVYTPSPVATWLTMEMTGASGATGVMLGRDSQLSKSKCRGMGY
jgi:hypothetical protein